MKVLEIYSGGLDSTILYHHLIAEGHTVRCLNFSYGSKHNERERAAARSLVPDLVEVDLDLSFLKSSLLKASEEAVPEGHYTDETMKSTVVPFRNGIMLSYAVGVAENENLDAVAFANHAGDHAIYPDCRREFVEAFGSAAETGTYNHVKLLSPFVAMSKIEIVKLGKSLGLEEVMFQTWSCYKGGAVHCGKCGTCVERREAFGEAGITDKTTYESN